MAQDPREPSVEDRVNEVLAQYLVRLDRGERIDLELFLQQHPDVADQLQVYFDDSQAVRNALDAENQIQVAATHSQMHASAETTGDREPSLPDPPPPAKNFTPTQVLAFAVDCGLLSARQRDEFAMRFGLGTSVADAEPLVEELCRLGKLTDFQWKALQQGRQAELVLGNYVLLEQLGYGGMGQVYKAWHRTMERVVALKTLRQGVAPSEQSVGRFRREVKVAASLVHPNIVTAYDADFAGSTCFLVMEYVAGQNLAQWVREHGPPPVPQAVDWVLQAARALDFAHQQGVIHRDVKPGNVMLNADGVVKVLDMGLARLAARVSATEDGLTRSGDVLGTIDYLAPEQALDTHQADQRADIYSLGCVLHYLLSGQSPYEGRTLSEKLLAHRKFVIPSLRAVQSDTPAWLDRLFQRMLAKSPGERPESMAEVIAELERHVAPAADLPRSADVVPAQERAGQQDAADQGRSGSKSSSDTAAQDARRAHRGGRRRTVVWIAIGTAVIAVMLGGIYSLRTAAGTLTVEVNEPEAKVEVLDAAGTVTVTGVSGAENLVFSIRPGRHLVKIEKDGFSFFAREFQMEARGQLVVRATMEPRVSRTRNPVPPNSPEPADTSPPRHGDLFQIVRDQLSGGTWIPVTPDMIAQWSLVERKQYARLAEPPKLTDNAIELRDMDLVGPVKFRDGAIRVKVRPIEGLSLMFSVRGAGQETRRATVDDRAYSLARQQFIPDIAWNTLAQRVKETTGPDEHEYMLAAVGEHLVLFVDGRPILYGQDMSPAAGVFGFSAVNGSAAELRDIEFLVLDDPPDESVRTAQQPKTPGTGPSSAKVAAPKAPRLPLSDAVVQAVNEQLARGQWVPLTPELLSRWQQTEMKGYTVLTEQTKLVDDAIQLREMSCNSDFRSCDGAIRMKARLIEGVSLVFGLRGSGIGKFNAFVDHRAFTLYRGQYLPERTSNEVLDYLITETNVGGEHEFMFAAVGERLVFYVDGRPILHARDPMPMIGVVTFGVPDDSSAEFRDIEVMILDDSPDGSVQRVVPPVRSPLVDVEGNWSLPPEAPAPAISPFDAEQAKTHQAAWAEYLDVPVEMTNSIGMKFAMVPPGEFDMGSSPEEIEAVRLQLATGNNLLDRLPTEGPVHRVKLTRSLYVGIHEVTQEEYLRVIGVNPSAFADSSDTVQFVPALTETQTAERVKWAKGASAMDTRRHPVESMTYDDARNFCRRLSELPQEQRAGRVYRLPTEAEWEYACRAGTTTRWYHGDDESRLEEFAWVFGTAKSPTHPVGTRAPNAWGLFDMHGNVLEMCLDLYSDSFYGESDAVDPRGPVEGWTRVVRGGAGALFSLWARSACRTGQYGIVPVPYCGFRVLVDVEPQR